MDPIVRSIAGEAFATRSGWSSDGTASASGGGGGAGRIRINTSSGAPSVGSATLSPSAKTACVSQGKLKP